MVAERLEHKAQRANRDPFVEQIPEHLLDLREPHDLRNQFVDRRRIGFVQLIDQLLGYLPREKLRGVLVGYDQ